MSCESHDTIINKSYSNSESARVIATVYLCRLSSVGSCCVSHLFFVQYIREISMSNKHMFIFIYYSFCWVIIFLQTITHSEPGSRKKMRKIPIFAKVCECDRIRIRNIAFFWTNLLGNDKYVHLLTRLCCTLHTHY